MKKIEIINKISEKTNLTKKDAEKALNAFIKTITETLQSGIDFKIIGFGTFYVKSRALRKGRNPKTGEIIKISATKVPSFKPGKDFKNAIKNIK